MTDIEFKRCGRQGNESAELTEDDQSNPINLFNSLVRARDPDTGELIERDDVISNAIAFLTAGSHSTAASLEIISWYLCRYQGLDPFSSLTSTMN